MTNYAIGCDKNNVATDQKNLDYVCKKFEEAGHTVKKLGVGPNVCQNFGKTSSSQGYMAIMMVNGADLQTYKDLYLGITKGYYHYKYCWFGLEGWINPSTCSCKGARTVKLKKAHDDASSSSFTSDIVGMTTAQVMEKYKSAINYACGGSVEELAENLLSGTGGGGDDGESNSSSIKEAIKEVLSFWDGEVECKVIGEKMYINKIKDPNTDTELELVEGVNIIDDSVSVTDINPDTVNFLTVHWKGGADIILKDEKLISRFGEKQSEVDAVKYIASKNSDENESEDKLESIPVETREEAEHFANVEWAKFKRENGHSIECKVVGDNKWKQGKWVKVNIPSFDEDCYMYLTKASHSESENGWETNIHLLDYPPSFGEPKEDSETEEEVVE